MTREEAIRCLDVYSSTNGSGLCTDKQHYEAKQMAIKALEQESCEDCISREEVLSLPRKMTYDFMGGVNFSGVDVDSIKELPSVRPKERTAHWIHIGERFYTCSSCGGSAVIVKADDLRTQYYVPYLTEWCPKCGARMIEIR